MFLALLVLALVLVAGLAVAARTRPTYRIPALIAGLVAAALAVTYFVASVPEPHLPVDVPPEEALGFVLAQRLHEDHPDGGKVIVFQPDTDDEKLVSIYNARMDGIRRILGSEYEIVQRGPLLRYGSLEDREAWFRMETGFPLTSFKQWATGDPDAVAAISMLGVPEGRLTAKTGLPPLYIAELRGIAWDPNRLPPGIAALVTYRSDRELDEARTKELLTVFEQKFTLYPAGPEGEAETGGDAAGP